MTEADEVLGTRTPIASDLLEGLKQVSLNQQITFKLYGRVVLPIDGYVFFVRSDLLARPIFQQSGLVTSGQLSQDEMKPNVLTATGSLHYTADVRQEEQETYAANRVVFTATEEINGLNDIAPGTLWIGEFDGLRFAFSSLSMRYRQAGLFHYQGFAVYPDMNPQVIDDVQATPFSSAQIVSNSLPAWLALAGYSPPWAFWGPLPTLFPSFLVPDNEAPPYAAVHIIPEETRGLASAPTIDRKTSTHTQLCTDRVRVTLWGARNTNALDFIDAVNQYTLDTAAFGIMNIPVFQDEKRTQAELGTIAMKKSAIFEISYLQQRMNNVARQQILTCIPTFQFGG
jgi:hypothetical protein